jgi:hypothetical protein
MARRGSFSVIFENEIGNGPGGPKKAWEAPPTHAFPTMWKGDLLLEKPIAQLTCLFRLPCFFPWKAAKSPNKEALKGHMTYHFSPALLIKLCEYTTHALLKITFLENPQEGCASLYIKLKREKNSFQFIRKPRPKIESMMPFGLHCTHVQESTQQAYVFPTTGQTMARGKDTRFQTMSHP